MGAAAVFALLAGCATTLPEGRTADPRDPFEPFNRGVSRFNEKVDDAVFRPVATAYRAAVPTPVRTGVSNFFNNLGDVWSTVNNTLQFKPQAAAESWMRFNVNTVFGLGGLIDVAGAMDIEPHNQDFGQTLAYYGVPTGPYLVLPLLGPSTVRDALATPVESKGNLLLYINHVPVRNSLLGLRIVDARANLLRASSVLDQAALDRYSFTRDIFLAVRRNEARSRRGGPTGDDGSLPPTPDTDDGVPSDTPVPAVAP